MKKALVVISLATVMTACSTTSMEPLRTENINKREVPSWYLEHSDVGSESKGGFKFWDKEGYLYAVAEDVSPSMEMALKKATLKAKAKVLDRITGEMNNRTTIVYEEEGGPEKLEAFQQGQDVIVNLISESVLRTYAVDKKMVVFNPETAHYRAFVLMKITKKDVENMAKEFDSRVERKERKHAGKDVNDVAGDVLNQAKNRNKQ
jgi:hypothetical protein